MITNTHYERLFRDEFATLASNAIWKDGKDQYTVFGRYQIIKENNRYRVFCSLTDIGLFSSTRTALSWCIADKFAFYNKARDIFDLDRNLYYLTLDIGTRARIGDNTKNSEQREIIITKLENKIIQKKDIENRLAKCVKWAKYYQQRGFDNETARTGHIATNNTNR